MRRLCRWAGVAALTTVCAAGAHASTHGEFAQHLQKLQGIVQACKATADACNGDVGADEKVGAEGVAPAFSMRWDWLRDALKQAAKDKPEQRVDVMDKAALHLDTLASEAGVEADAGAKARSDAEFARANEEAKRVLARAEFREVRGVTWWQRLLARVETFLGTMFDGVGQLAKRAGWLGRLLMWVCFLGAGAGFLLFLMRMFARQRMQIAMAPAGTQINAWDREANDWAKEAETCAARGAWRDAVHCLYWAAIVRLESKRAWRHNPSRTPREYVRLLKPGSAQQGALRGLTNIFERVWYGLREAHSADYERAKTLFEGLSDKYAAATTAEPNA